MASELIFVALSEAQKEDRRVAEAWAKYFKTVERLGRGHAEPDCVDSGALEKMIARQRANYEAMQRGAVREALPSLLPRRISTEAPFPPASPVSLALSRACACADRPASPQFGAAAFLPPLAG